jgi:glutathione S-transferase
MTIQLFHNPQSRATIMHWLLEEIGVEYELVRVNYDDGSMRTPDFLEVSPLGKIPAIRDGDVTVSDTVAIALYLADKYKTPNDLAPAIDDPRRGEYLRWLVFQASSVEPAMMQAGAQFETKRQQAGWGDVDTVVDALEARLSKADPWLLGDWFTAADVVLGGAVGWAIGWNLFPKKPAMAAYAARLQDRPAYQKAMGG